MHLRLPRVIAQDQARPKQGQLLEGTVAPSYLLLRRLIRLISRVWIKRELMWVQEVQQGQHHRLRMMINQSLAHVKDQPIGQIRTSTGIAL